MFPIVHKVYPESRTEVEIAYSTKCIYCGLMPPDVKLTKEHIIPDGLGGDLTYVDASCLRCNKKTQAFEGPALRKMFRDVRGMLGIRSRKKRPKQDQEFFEGKTWPGQRRSQPFSANSPAMACLFTTSTPPGIAIGLPASSQVEVTPYYLLPSDNIARMDNSFGTGDYYLQTTIHPGIIGQVVAKVAHAYACACLGVQNFTPLLLEYIDAKKPALDTHLIGSRPQTDLVPERAHHTLSLDFKRLPAGDFYVVEFCMFASLGAPVFCVVVGRPIYR
jgi:hypothetical protein